MLLSLLLLVVVSCRATLEELVTEEGQISLSLYIYIDNIYIYIYT